MSLPLFTSALSTLYGPLPPPPPSSPETWSPPERSGGHKGRYLWTDAFGVLDLLTLHRETSRSSTSTGTGDVYLTLAARLITTVHDVLGRTRDGLSRLPGATDSNPLGGGLRIGKTDADGPDGDGQYHHYLTLWMFALNRMSVASGDKRYNEQAIALARAIHAPFFVNRGSVSKPRMVWKMSSSLDEVLVGSEGNLDAVDGFVVFRLLQATDKKYRRGGGESSGEEVLAEEINDYRRVMERKGHHFVSSDPLDLGMTLWTMHWVSHEPWAQEIVERCYERLYDLLETSQHLSRNPKYRLAFREFGTALGIKCMAAQDAEKERSVDMRAYADRILENWATTMEVSLGDEHRDATPDSLRPITRVMYAAALVPGAFQRGYFGPEARL
ncbi:hypothetical protein BJY01DRAFT_234309 [Aspergillus pseudoustus]|uniref:Six-hairpin glycosidase-like protein n=1 Tax=Aspergillus pseudoustus TaxID=1810923 RepID=A0ABR4K4H4_9EURO